MIGAPLLLLFANEYADTVITVSDESLYGITITDAALYGCTITDTMAYSATVTDSVVYGCTVTDDDAYGCTVSDATLAGNTPMAYDIGDVARLSVAFANSAGAATDPTTVTLKLELPDGTEKTLTYALAEITKDSTGNYHYDHTITLAGRHTYKYLGTGTVVAAEEAAFVVKSSVF